MQLFIDDGVPSRGHRNNLFTDSSNVTGNFSGPHSRYGFMTCITYANGYDNAVEDEPTEISDDSVASAEEARL